MGIRRFALLSALALVALGVVAMSATGQLVPTCDVVIEGGRIERGTVFQTFGGTASATQDGVSGEQEWAEHIGIGGGARNRSRTFHGTVTSVECLGTSAVILASGTLTQESTGGTERTPATATINVSDVMDPGVGFDTYSIAGIDMNGHTFSGAGTLSGGNVRVTSAN